MKILFTGVAAASVLLCVYVASLRRTNDIPMDSNLVAEVKISRGSVEYVITEKYVDTVEENSVGKTVFINNKPRVTSEMIDEELERAAQIVDDALLSVFSGIRKGQEEALQSIESIKIDQKSVINKF